MNEEKNKAARAYVTGTVFTDETGSDEALIPNMRFMAFSAGADWGAKSERERILKMISEVRGQLETTHNEKYKDTHLGYVIAAYDFEHFLKQKLAEEL